MYKKILDLNDVIAYECHVKGVSNDKSAKTKYPGTFKGLTERLQHIKKLGVNQLILLPVYDFDDSLCEVYGAPKDVELDKSDMLHNYWGFSKGDYYNTKASYGVEDSNKEFIELIDTAHEMGIEIIMTVHFNSDENTFLMISVLEHWHREYHVDGFFLNVNPYYLKMISDDPILWKAKLYTYEINENLKFTNPERIAVYDYGFRNILRRMLRGDERAFEEYYNFLKSDFSIKHIISITSHNGFTLKDLYSYNRKHNEANGEFNRDGENINFSDNFGVEGDTADAAVCEERLKATENALLMLLLTKGLPMLLAGDEAGNSQKGNNNAYCQDNEIGWVQYEDKVFERLSEIIMTAVNLRKESGAFVNENNINCSMVNVHSMPMLSIHTGEAWDCYLDYFTKHGGILYALDDCYLYIAANFDKYERILPIPHLPKDFKWSMIAGNGVKNHITEDYYKKCSDFILAAKSVQIFIGKKN